MIKKDGKDPNKFRISRRGKSMNDMNSVVTKKDILGEDSVSFKLIPLK